MQTSDSAQTDWQLIEELAAESSDLFVKKLSRNDTSWADSPSKHQSGFYIPADIRQSGFFPQLQPDNPNKPHILHASCLSLWPQTGEVKESGLRHYTNKGPETHFTVVPKHLFAGLNPASMLVCGKFSEPGARPAYWVVILDSESTDSELLETALDLDSEFRSGIFSVAALSNGSRIERSDADQLIDDLQLAIRTGTLEQFARAVATMPSSALLAEQARSEFIRRNSLTDLNPLRIPAPGDALMQISRDIEFEIYKKYELRKRAAEIVRIMVRSPDVATAAVQGFPQLDALFLSASQQRRSRAGMSMELHLAAMLRDGRILYEAQAVLGGRRPDFVLPSKKSLMSPSRSFLEAMVLASKTTLRERWKQVTHEKFNCDVFLATVDDRVSDQARSQMADLGIRLVVPESLKNDRKNHYFKDASVITFKDFFLSEVAMKRPFLIKLT